MFMIMVFLKLFHLFFLFVWLGSLLFITRAGSVIERSGLKSIYITTNLPSMSLALTFGIILFIMRGASFQGGWFHMKLTMVSFLVLTDILVGKKLFGKTQISKKYFLSTHFMIVFLLLMVLFSIYVLKFLIVKNGS